MLYANSLFAQVTISSTQTWNTLPIQPPNNGYAAGITVTGAGTTLTISNIVLSFFQNSTIRVENGAKLIIHNGAILKFEDNCQINIVNKSQLLLNNATLEHINGMGYWKGITAEKDETEDQFAIYPVALANGNCSQAEWGGTLNPQATLVEINGSTIKNAQVGVESVFDNTSNPKKWGAIVRVRESVFLNCIKGVKLSKNHAINQVQGKYFCASFVMRSEFNWTNTLAMPKSELNHIYLENADGVRIGGCIFKNTDNVKRCYTERGVGIKAIGTGFSVSNDGDKCCPGEGDDCPDNCYAQPGKSPRRNTFEYLGLGIDQIGSKELAIGKSDFNNCGISINLEYNNSSIGIKGNNFDSDAQTYQALFSNNNCVNPTPLLGIRSVSSSGFNINGNVFSTTLTDFNFIQTNNAGGFNLFHSFIKNNEFNLNINITMCHRGAVGIYIKDNNDNLDISCNTFNTVSVDILVSHNGTIDDIPNMAAYGNSQTLLYHNNTHSNLINQSSCFENISNENPNSTIKILRVPLMPFSYYGNFDFPPTPSQFSVECPFKCNELEAKSTSISKVKELEFSFYPNPTNGILEIETPYLNSAFRLNIYDLLGRNVFETPITSNSSTIDIGNLPAGVYIIRLNDNVSSISKKIVLQK